VLTVDGRVLAFTPEARRELEEKHAEDGRFHLALVEWGRLTAGLDMTSPAVRFQLFFGLMRLFFDIPKNGKEPIDERVIRRHLNEVARCADRPAVRRRLVAHLIESLLPSTEQPS